MPDISKTTGRANVDNDLNQQNTWNGSQLLALLQSLQGKVVEHYFAQTLVEAATISTTHVGALVVCPNGIVVNGMLVATPDQSIILTTSGDHYLRLSVDGVETDIEVPFAIKALGDEAGNRITTTYATKAEVADLIQAARAMVYAGEIDASTGRLTAVNEAIFGSDWMDDPNKTAFSTLNRYIEVKAGWTFRIANAGDILCYGWSGHLEEGDMVLMLSDLPLDTSGTGYIVPGDLTVVQNNIDKATPTALGLVKVPTTGGLSVDNNGSISLHLDTNSGLKISPTSSGIQLNASLSNEQLSTGTTGIVLKITDSTTGTVLASTTIVTATPTNGLFGVVKTVTGTVDPDNKNKTTITSDNSVVVAAAINTLFEALCNRIVELENALTWQEASN